MKTFMAVLALLLIPTVLAHAYLHENDLQTPVYLTEEAALLSQVDAVSLYISNEKISHAPRLNSDNVSEVDTTIIDPALLQNSAGLQKYVSRHIDTFISVLKERLPVYAPNLAKTFNEREDIIFVIKAVPAGQMVAEWGGGTWRWASGWQGGEYLPAMQTAGSYAPIDKGKLGCNCPARVK